MLEPDAMSRAAEHPGVPASRFGPEALQILTTEHWSLLAARSLVYTEALSRTSIFVAALTGSVVALALVAQASQFGTEFIAFALVLLPVVYFLGLATFVRLIQVNSRQIDRVREGALDPLFPTPGRDDA